MHVVIVMQVIIRYTKNRQLIWLFPSLDQIYSAMVVYGLLTYEDGAVSVPNRELMDKFDELLLTNHNLGYI